jgi:hypothetical protein
LAILDAIPLTSLNGIVEKIDKDLVADAEFIQKDDELSVEESIGEPRYLGNQAVSLQQEEASHQIQRLLTRMTFTDLSGELNFSIDCLRLYW